MKNESCLRRHYTIQHKQPKAKVKVFIRRINERNDFNISEDVKLKVWKRPVKEPKADTNGVHDVSVADLFEEKDDQNGEIDH